MKLNKFKVTAIFFFKSGNSKKVDWIEERLVKRIKKEDQEVTEPLSLLEADAFFQGKFKEWKDNGSTIVRKNVKGEASVVPFSEVEYVTVAVEIVEDAVKDAEDKKEVAEADSTPISRGIESHPAFKKH